MKRHQHIDIKKILIIVVVIATLSTLNAVQQVEPLRLAVWNNSSTAVVSSSGKIMGFEPDLFRLLSPYFSRSVEIKAYDNKAASLEALRAGEVDVVMSSLYTSDIDEEFDFTNISVRQVDALLCSVDNSYSYQEYSKMKNKSIGYLDRGATMQPILDYLSSKIENPKFIPFDTVAQIRTALDKKEIDLATFGIGALLDKYQILDRFYSLPTFYITREGETPILNKALTSFFNNEIDAYNALYYKYYPRSITTEFTKDEIAYIKSNPEIKIASFINQNVFSSLDSNGELIGVFPDIIREINKITNLNISVVPYDKMNAIEELLNSDEVDGIIGIDCLSDIRYSSKFRFSDNIMKIPMELIIKRTTLLDKNGVQTVALSTINCHPKDFILENYPNWKIIYEDDIEKRYKMLVDDEVDCLIDSSFSFNYLKDKPNNINLSRYPVSIYSSSLNIVLSSSSEEQLFSIINKALLQIKNKNINSIIDENISKIVYTPSLFDLFISHKIEYIGILLIIFFFFVVLYIIANNRRRIELEKANEELKIAEQEANSANRAKSAFLARMSHDMRTPLGAVIGLADFGKSEAKDQKLWTYFDEINSSAKYLLSLMDDILDSQKLQNDNFEFDYKLINLCDTYKRVKTVVENRAKEKKLNLVITSDCEQFDKCVYADEKRISQILINILNNAIKYTPENGYIYWNSSFEIIDDEKVLLHCSIRDTGVGMSEDFVNNHLFEPFSKETNSLSKSEGGSGLGLNICKKLIDQMNGSIACESKLGQGSKFTISISFKIANDEETENYNEEKKNKKRKYSVNNLKDLHILVCDDTEINIKIVKKILEKKSMIVDVAYNGQEAVDKIKTYYYDAVLMDIRMPILDGLKATKKIREFNKKIPIIAISANAYEKDVKQSLDAGMNAHLAKPIDTEKLFETLSSFFN